MKISQISIKKLFGTFDHTVNLNLDENVTIIHGPNGVGKTTILRLVNALFNKNVEELRTIPFEELLLKFDDGSILSLKNNRLIKKKADESLKRRENEQFSLSFQRKSEKLKQWNTDLRFDPREFRFPISYIERIVPFLERVGPTRWLDERTGETLSFDLVVEKYKDLLPSDIRKFQTNWPEWFESIIDKVTIRFVRAQRLLLLGKDSENYRYHRTSEDDRRTQVSEAVSSYSSQLKNIIRQCLAESSILSQSLDRTFPKRLIDNYQQKKMIPQDELNERLANVEKKRKFLINVGLYDPEKVDIQTPNVNDAHIQSVLSVYVKDAEDKLVVFDELAAKIDLLVKLINGRFRFKKMIIDKENGFVFETEQGRLSPEDLSSGEQHELVLIYELLFQTKKDTLVLIDEPELSLHIGWQIHFLEDLKQIINLSGIYAILATHSPQIINNSWDLTVKLGEDKND